MSQIPAEAASQEAADVSDWALQMLIEAAETTGEEVANWIRGRISTACDGRHHSPVGSPPWMETGTLFDSVGFSVTTADEDHVVLEVGAGPAFAEDGYDYSADLELGTGVMTGPRPYVLDLDELAAEQLAENLARGGNEP